MQKALVYHNGDLIKTYEFDKPTIGIGRLPINEISINSMSISRTHLQLQYNPQAHSFLALESKSLNGTLLNGAKVEANTPIPSGSVLVIGQYSIHFEYSAEVAASPTTSIATTPDSDELTGTITLPAFAPKPKPKAQSSASMQDGLYFGDHSKGKATSSSQTVAVLIEQGTMMEYSIAKKDITFGNAPNDDIFIEEGKLAKITVSGSVCEIKALKVMGKIVVNNNKVGQQILNDGDIFKVGKSSFTFKMV